MYIINNFLKPFLLEIKFCKEFKGTLSSKSQIPINKLLVLSKNEEKRLKKINMT